MFDSWLDGWVSPYFHLLMIDQVVILGVFFFFPVVVIAMPVVLQMSSDFNVFV